ncbi:helix-turn-helix domain-containing protein [Stutzerimonas kirkiae]|uniref:AraC family transcriptional regulator n=2 Tax=Stutzerimonas kirkiae TaxID=2211392 RepID=A0A4V2KCG1_9GAMM|nr:AraC family transcriptional regulator [Stutzerimonas kirkiae]TBU94047.1 AraC family transcriptional regulator [Stutzerimonas kirkiae]TBV06137.1 AraC family transcriptional regulator [Stutzerimonas kirkiae]TBV06579.1 AraC family transcriptional regulator [Stutzerimonas kirkiae]TBV13698.1 AraC family transcriptional regulator [Stutzerimonas kirkiae]
MSSQGHIVKTGELSELVNDSIRLVENEPCQGSLFQGHLSWQKLRSGLSLHCSDCLELHNFSTQVEISPRLNFILFLDGQSDVSFDDRPFTFGAPRGPGKPSCEGVTIALNESALFSRQARRGRRIRKVSVSMAPEWFESGGLDGHGALRELIDFEHHHLDVHRWQPSARLLALAEQVLHPISGNRLLHNLYLESRALEIANEALSQLTRRPAQALTSMRPHEHQRIRRTLELLHSDQADGWSLEQIAREVGCSPSTLHRQFQASKGLSLFEYQRQRKLQQARDALEQQGASISQAAWLAGYSSAANFSTAFKRTFGITPKQVRTRF